MYRARFFWDLTCQVLFLLLSLVTIMARCGMTDFAILLLAMLAFSDGLLFKGDICILTVILVRLGQDSG